MKNSYKKIISVVLTIIILLTAAPMSGFVGLKLNLDWLNFDWLDFSTKSSALEATGQCGDNVYWTFDESTGTLTISGTGDMENYSRSSSNRSPFYNTSIIKNVIIESGVMSIGRNAFYSCTGLTSVTIPDSVTSIGDYAFEYCSELVSITIPDSVTSIGNSAFDYTGYYKDSSNWENDVLYIGNHLIKAKSTVSGDYTIKSETKCIADSAFWNCTGLTSITIPDSVTSIGTDAFYNCHLEYVEMGDGLSFIPSCLIIKNYLKTFLIGNSVTSIGNSAFSYCNGLTSVTIGNSVTSIGDSAFKDCAGLTSVTIPDSVTSIGNYAFEDCTGLTSITIPDSVTSIGDEAFCGTGLTSVTIPDSVTSIGYDAFYGCTLTSVNISSIESWCNISFNNYASNPLYFAHFLYLNDELVTDLIIPDRVTSIGSYAFYFCTGLTSVTIGNSVTSIGNDAFCGCTGLTSITISDSVTSIGNSAFSGCTGLTIITIPDSVTSIGEYAFLNCTGLTSVTIGNSVTSIGDFAFRDCTGLKSITIGNSVTSIGSYAFYGCTGLTTVNFNAVNCTFMDQPFRDCTGTVTLNIGENVTSIPDYAFKRFSGLNKVVFNTEDYLDIGAGAFDECYNAVICCKENSYMHYYADRKGMQYCIIDEGGNPSFTVENDILVSYTGSGENIFVSSASKIGFAAFDGNENLKSVELASNVTRIYNQAFRNCSSLEKIVIPKSVTSIGSSAFSGCDNLTIWCYSGSYAQTFAENHDIPYTLIKLDLSQTSLTAADSETLSLTASFTTDLIDEDKITWTSSDTDVAVVENGIVNILDFGEVQITASTASGLSAECLISVDAKLKPGVDAEIDREENLLSGADIINKNPDEIKNMFANSNVEVSSETSKAGTGSTVTLYRANGGIFKEIEILIYGDVNSDGVYDAQDAFIVNCIANGMLTREQVGEAKFLAADCNHDGEVNSSDVLILEQAGLLLSKVEQAKDEEMKEQALGEYLDLIDQNPEINEADETTEEKTASIFDRIIEFVKKIIGFIKSIAAKF